MSTIAPTAPTTTTETTKAKQVSGTKSKLTKLYEKELSGVGIEVRDIPGRGRGLVSTKSFKPGSRIMRLPPSVSVLGTPHLTTTCHGCFLTPSEKEIFLASGNISGKTVRVKLSRCSKCKTLHYCSRECQLADWPIHKQECTAFSRLRTMYHKTYPDRVEDEGDARWAGPEGVRAVGRLCWQRRAKMQAGKGKEDRDGWWDKLGLMESHVKQAPEKDIMKLASQVQHLEHYLSASKPLLPGEDPAVLHPSDMSDYGFNGVGDVLNLCSAIQVNAFTLTSPSLAPVGMSVSPLLALANHSCEPNAIAVFPKGGRDIYLVALNDIPPGEEILTSYIDTSTPYHHRQSELLSRYHFVCHCSLCQKSESTANGGQSWVDPRWCVRHGECSKEGKAAMPLENATGEVEVRCIACNQDFKVDADRVRKLVREGMSFLESDERGTLDKSYALKVLPTLLSHLLSLTPPSSHPTFALLRLHSLLLIPPSTFSELNLAISHLSSAYSASCISLPQNHPIQAVILAEWSKLLALDRVHNPEDEGQKGEDELVKRLEMAIVVGRRAVMSAQKGWGGDGGVVGVEMEGLVRSCEGELGLVRARRMGRV